jgi:chaperonin GroEL
MKKKVIYGEAAQDAIVEAAQFLRTTVGSTLGAGGKFVAAQRIPHDYTVTKDGVTVAREVEHERPEVNLVVKMLKEAAEKTARNAGDGTTSTTVLASNLIEYGIDHVRSGEGHTYEYLLGWQKAAELLLKEVSSKVNMIDGDLERLKQIANISANGDSNVASLITQAIEAVGSAGTVTVGESLSGLDEVNISDGLTLDSGYANDHFINDHYKQSCILEKPFVMVTDTILRYVDEVRPAMEIAAQKKQPLFILCEGVTGEALSILAINALKQTLPSVVVVAPELGQRRKDWLKDVATVVGATILGDDIGIKPEAVLENMLGHADKVEVTATKTRIINGQGSEEQIEARIASIKTQLETVTNSYDQEKLQQRLAKMTGGVAVIGVAATSELELREKRYRIEDAIFAAQSAIESGYVAGAGVALYDAAQSILGEEHSTEYESRGYLDFLSSAQQLKRYIIENAGLRYNDKDMSEGECLDVTTGELTSALDKGIIDPYKVVENVVKNSLSVAKTAVQISTLVYYDEGNNENR